VRDRCHPAARTDACHRGVASVTACRSLPTLRLALTWPRGVAAAEGSEHGQRQQLAGQDVDAAAGEVVAEAVGRQHALYVLLVVLHELDLEDQRLEI